MTAGMGSALVVTVSPTAIPMGNLRSVDGYLRSKLLWIRSPAGWSSRFGSNMVRTGNLTPEPLQREMLPGEDLVGLIPIALELGKP